MSSTTITFSVLSDGHNYTFSLAKDDCHWDAFYAALVNALPDKAATTPLYSFDGANGCPTIVNGDKFAALISNASNNQVQLHIDDNFTGKSASGEWIFAPEEETSDPSSSVPLDGPPFSELYLTCFEQLGQVVRKHGALIDANHPLRILIGRFSASLAATPQVHMVTQLDQFLGSYSNAGEKVRGKDKHCGRHRRRDFINSLPDDLSHFLFINGRHRHHHHGIHSFGRSPWMDQHPSHYGPGSFFGGGKHKHLHQHHHHHGPWFGLGRHEAKKHWKQAWKEHHQQADTSSSDSSSSDSDDNYRQQYKLWKCAMKERRHHHHRGPHGPHHHGGAFPHDPSTFAGFPLGPSAFAGFPHGPSPFAGRPPLPGYFEESFGQMHLGNPKKQ
jgi:hypothetical protein